SAELAIGEHIRDHKRFVAHESLRSITRAIRSMPSSIRSTLLFEKLRRIKLCGGLSTKNAEPGTNATFSSRDSASTSSSFMDSGSSTQRNRPPSGFVDRAALGKRRSIAEIIACDLSP